MLKSSKKIFFVMCLILESSPIFSEDLLESPQTLDTKSSSDKAVANKIFVRSGGGILTNLGAYQGSGLTYGAGNIGFVYFVLEQISLGVAYRIDTDFVTVPMRGFDLSGRYYFWDSGTRVQISNRNGDVIETHHTWNPYLLAELSSRDVYVDPSSTGGLPLNGTLINLNSGVGLDVRLSRHYELTAEADITVLPFTSSDPRIEVEWMLFNFGLNYVF